MLEKEDFRMKNDELILMTKACKSSRCGGLGWRPKEPDFYSLDAIARKASTNYLGANSEANLDFLYAILGLAETFTGDQIVIDSKRTSIARLVRTLTKSGLDPSNSDGKIALFLLGLIGQSGKSEELCPLALFANESGKLGLNLLLALQLATQHELVRLTYQQVMSYYELLLNASPSKEVLVAATAVTNASEKYYWADKRLHDHMKAPNSWFSKIATACTAKHEFKQANRALDINLDNYRQLENVENNHDADILCTFRRLDASLYELDRLARGLCELRAAAYGNPRDVFNDYLPTLSGITTALGHNNVTSAIETCWQEYVFAGCEGVLPTICSLTKAIREFCE